MVAPPVFGSSAQHLAGRVRTAGSRFSSRPLVATRLRWPSCPRTYHRPPISSSLQHLLRMTRDSGRFASIVQAVLPVQDPDEMRRIIDDMSDDDNKALFILLLAEKFQSRIEQSGRADISTIDQAIDACEAAGVRAFTDSVFSCSRVLLGQAFEARARCLRDTSGLQEGIDGCRRAVELFEAEPDEPLCALRTLASVCSARFELGNSEDLADVEEAMASHRRVLELEPDYNPQLLQRLLAFARSTMRLIDVREDGDTLPEACTWLRYATELLPDEDQRKPAFLVALGGYLTRCFTTYSGNVDEIHDTIVVLVRAIELTSHSDLARSAYIHHLATALLSQALSRLYKPHECGSLAQYLPAVDLLPDDHAEKLILLEHMTISFRARLAFKSLCHDYDSEQANIDFDMSTMLTRRILELRMSNSTFDAATATLIPRLLLQSVYLTLYGASRMGDPISDAAMASFTPRLLLQSVYVTLYSANLDLRLLFPEDIATTDLVGAAIARALERDDAASALNWFDQERTTPWIQEFRTPRDEIRELFRISEEGFLPMAQKLDSARLRGASQYRHTLVEYRNLLVAIRKHRMVQNLLRFGSNSRLSFATLGGTVACINMHTSRCDALIVHGSYQHHVHLPGLTPSLAHEWQRKLNQFIRLEFAWHARKSGPKVARYGRVSSDRLLEILRRMWSVVVQPIFAFLGWTYGGSAAHRDGRHIRWCTRGSLTLLPLHAAGPYDGSSLNACDIAVSSYTSTLEALLQADRGGRSTAPPSILVVAQSNASGGVSLPGTKMECEYIQRHFSAPPSKFLVDAEATATAVLDNMSAHPYIHLACHGRPDAANPMDSAFLLHNSKLTLRALMGRSSRTGELAFLSACETSKGHEMIPDEAVHLATGMLTAGYRSVVGTLWPIDDSAAPLVADVFYKELLKSRGEDGRLDVAWALHTATKAVRKQFGDHAVAQWAPFVHFGL